MRNVCIIVTSLGGGGAERVASIQSEILEDLGYNVFLVTVLNHIEYNFKGTLLNLGLLKDKKDGFFARLGRLFVLKRFLKDKKIDLIIDHRTRSNGIKELLLKYIVFRSKMIFMIHNINLDKYFSSNIFLSRFLYMNAACMVSVSKSIEAKVKYLYGLNNVQTIYNPIKIDVENDNSSIKHNNFILYFGRLDEEAKDLSFLITAYKKSSLVSKGIDLVLLGDGPDKLKLKRLVSELNLTESVIFLAHTKTPFPYVKNSLFTVLTSFFEGFPMSVIESLANETPVVSCNNISGVGEIITNNYNGLLVEKSIEVFADALDRMATDKELLATCKKNCLASIEHLSYENIKNDWKELLETI